MGTEREDHAYLSRDAFSGRMITSHGNQAIGVVIPTFNRPHLVRRAVQSVLDQSPSATQIIVVNDGGEDPTAALSDLLEGQRVQLVTIPNGGLSAARNLGAGLLDTPLLFFLDDDDEVLPGAFKELAAVHISDPFVAAAGGMIFRADGADGRVSLPPPTEQLAARMLEANQLHVGATLVDRAAFDAVGGFDASIRAMEDYTFWMCLLGRGEIRTIQRPVLRYYVGHGSMTTDRWEFFSARQIVRRISQAWERKDPNAGQKVIAAMIDQKMDSVLWLITYKLRQRDFRAAAKYGKALLSLWTIEEAWPAGIGAWFRVLGRHLHGRLVR